MNATDIFSNKEIEELILKGYLFESGRLKAWVQHIEKLTTKGYLYVKSNKSDKTKTEKHYVDVIRFKTFTNVSDWISALSSTSKILPLYICHHFVKFIYPSYDVSKEEGIRFYKTTISRLLHKQDQSKAKSESYDRYGEMINKYKRLYNSFKKHFSNEPNPETKAQIELEKFLNNGFGLGEIMLVSIEDLNVNEGDQQ